jgi:hypothetical protein
MDVEVIPVTARDVLGLRHPAWAAKRKRGL